MREETYLDIYLSPAELTYDIKKIILVKLRERYLFKEFNQRMITNIELNHKGGYASIIYAIRNLLLS